MRSLSTQAKPRSVKPRPLPFKPGLSGLAGCVEDARLAGLDHDPGPSTPLGYQVLLARLRNARAKLPPIHQQSVADPFLEKLQALGKAGFQQILSMDPDKQGAARLMLDIAAAILQNGGDYQCDATAAFAEVVADLYDGFLSAEDRSGIKMPDRTILPPLVKWGNPDAGPYTWPFDTTSTFGVKTAVVSMPPANTRMGLVTWTALGHETCGHDILHANVDLQGEMVKNVRSSLLRDATLKNTVLPDYWATRMDETASDVMGILNMGPAAAIGLIACFRGLNAAYGTGPTLRSEGPAQDPHPADVLRGYLAASSVRLLEFDHREAWAAAIEAEADRDLGKRTLTLAGKSVTTRQAKDSAAIVARQLAEGPSEILNGHSLKDIQDWRNRDEDIVAALRGNLTKSGGGAPALSEDIYATHVVAAAVLAALANEAPIPVLFARMIALLKDLRDRNPVWGPLAVAHRGSIAREFAFVSTP